MGSNSFRLEIAELSKGRYKRVEYIKENVRLGAGLDAQGMLTEEAAQRGLRCLATFAEKLEGFAGWQIRAVATQTLREARNRDAFLLRAQAVLKHPIEVISGREEARLIYQGVARLQPTLVPRLVIDIGGRSTELILGHGRTVERAESFRVGSVSLSLAHFGDGRFTAQAFRNAQIAAGAELEEALDPFAPIHWQEALGSSGTVGAVAQLLQANGQSPDGLVTPEGLRWCIERCIEAGSVDKLNLPGLKADRKPVLGGGLSILYTLAMHFDIQALRPAKGALRQGVVFDLEERIEAITRHGQRDQRDLSVRELQRRFLVDQAHADRVGQRALHLWSGLKGSRTSQEEVEAARELHWAAALHEVGMMVSRHDHHRHSAYLLGHVDAAGFSQSQQRRLAELVLGHRGELGKLSNRHDEGLMRQVLCLRLASILHHARASVPASVAALQHQGKEVTLRLQQAWADQHPRTLHLLDEEARLWIKEGDRVLQIKLSESDEAA